MRVALGTNVLISALVVGGSSREVLDKAIRGELTLRLSDQILSEVCNALQGPKFGFPAAIAVRIYSELSAISEVVVPCEEIHEIRVDPAQTAVFWNARSRPERATSCRETVIS